MATDDYSTRHFGSPSPVERIKKDSHGLRGSLRESLANELTGALAPDDHHLIKFHGMYEQDDRDRREERERRKLERDFSFMIRLRLPGGEVTAPQWLAIQRLADQDGTGVVKITTRQTVQLHGVIKSKLKPVLKTFHALGLDSIAACGDVNRNVLAGAHPAATAFAVDAFAFAQSISERLLPKSRAWYEIWLDEEKLEEGAAEEDPLYEDRYLPRKFKVAVAIPPYNDTDVFSNDVGLIAIEENGGLAGFNVAAGGGMGVTHGSPETYPRLGTILGYTAKERVLEVVWQIAAVQRDFGNRSDRKLARLKYTMDRMGVNDFRGELERRLGFTLEPERPFAFTVRQDQYGWMQDLEKRWYCALFAECGRVTDEPGRALRTGLMEIAATGLARFRLTANQNIMVSCIRDEDRSAVMAILEKHGLARPAYSPIRSDALACVALNTCPLALAEGQRYLPALVTKVEEILERRGLKDEPVSIRMTGCPNGCARPHLAEIGLVGRSLGFYNLHLGGDALGRRLNTLYAENLDEPGILETLDRLLGEFAAGRQDGERFGDFVHRVHLAKAGDVD